MMYAYFPGCSAHSTGISCTNSYNYVALAAGIELAEIPNWNCCGASAAHAESDLLGDALPARSLALSEEAFGHAPVLAPCAGCYLHLKTATAHAQENDEDEFSSSTSSTVLGVRRLMLPTAWSLSFQPKRKNDSPNAYAFPSMD